MQQQVGDRMLGAASLSLQLLRWHVVAYLTTNATPSTNLIDYSRYHAAKLPLQVPLKNRCPCQKLYKTRLT